MYGIENFKIEARRVISKYDTIWPVNLLNVSYKYILYFQKISFNV